MSAAIVVESSGIATSIVDAGRPGRAAFGLPRGGACDLAALTLANRLVGNDEGAKGWETCGGLTLVALRPVMVAVTGAQVDLFVDGGPPVGWGAPALLPPGARLRVGRVRQGLRAYLALRGGLLPGSVTDPLQVGPDPGTPAATESAVPAVVPTALTVWPGPRAAWFIDAAWHTLLSAEYTVSPQVDRVGARLDGPSLERRISGELPSEGMIEGAVQVPTDGRPIIMLADHPTTGGYPVIAVVDPAHLTHAAQLAPGTRVRFTLLR